MSLKMFKKVFFMSNNNGSAFASLYASASQFNQFAIAHKDWVRDGMRTTEPKVWDFIVELPPSLNHSENPEALHQLTLAEIGIEYYSVYKNASWSTLQQHERVIYSTARLSMIRKLFHTYLQERYNVTENESAKQSWASI